ncbi:ATP-dependent DNA ligase [Alteromonas sp. RKMC-009]|uniref:ATP-dependent DNA ligase n=1 Tax=Alteromonas sp. RKMC-009 TaxID=2267264 RepID=UPI000E699E5D|nr:hypothetical protein [Alteromonas sp. RKMC-009]AYA64266.1 hypothetical protein DS731_09825 [Alteromonas sp. RKMC-009]
MQFNQLLYKAHSNGSIGSWEVKVTGTDAEAVMTVIATKKLGGKSVETPRKITKGKNIGRANETTPLQQAIAEAQSKVNKQLDKGYTVDMPEAGSVSTNALSFQKPMLAQPVDKVKDWDFPVYVQPKMDGHRMLAAVQDDKVVLYSRQGKVIDCEHIRATLQSMYDSEIWLGDTLDGEIYAHGLSLQTISSLVKKPKPESEQLRYNLYDIMVDQGYRHRLALLMRMLDHFSTEYVTLTQTTVLNDHAQLNHMHGVYIGEGYEGTMIRQLDFPYGKGKRCKSLMKKKDIQDAEFLITGLTEGKVNERLGTRVGIWICQTKEGKVFEVTAAGDAQEKHDVAVNGRQQIGKYLTIFFFGYTPEGAPFHVKDSRVREDI